MTILLTSMQIFMNQYFDLLHSANVIAFQQAEQSIYILRLRLMPRHHW